MLCNVIINFLAPRNYTHKIELLPFWIIKAVSNFCFNYFDLFHVNVLFFASSPTNRRVLLNINIPAVHTPLWGTFEEEKARKQKQSETKKTVFERST